MTKDDVARALSWLTTSRDRVSTALLELEDHLGYRLLSGNELRGETEKRWQAAQARMAELWQLFDAYRRVLDEAERLHARRSPPEETELAELSKLLTGQVIELEAQRLPLAERSLLGPSRERLSLNAAIERMDAAYRDVIEIVAAADALWSALLPPLAEAEEVWQEANIAHAELQAGDDGFEQAGRELATVRMLVREDPFALADAGGRADISRIESVRETLSRVRTELAEAVRLKNEFADRIESITVQVDLLEEAEREQRRTHAEVTEKIVPAQVPKPLELPTVLRRRLNTLVEDRAPRLRRQGRWTDLAGLVAQLSDAVIAAQERMASHMAAISGLLNRRGELRGRLEAYHAKAGRLGHAEDLELMRLHQHARDLLWTAPCDLREATVAVARFSDAVGALERGRIQD